MGQECTWSSPRHVEPLKIWQTGDAMVTHLMPWKRKCKGMDPIDPTWPCARLNMLQRTWTIKRCVPRWIGRHPQSQCEAFSSQGIQVPLKVHLQDLISKALLRTTGRLGFRLPIQGVRKPKAKVLSFLQKLKWPRPLHCCCPQRSRRAGQQSCSAKPGVQQWPQGPLFRISQFVYVSGIPSVQGLASWDSKKNARQLRRTHCKWRHLYRRATPSQQVQNLHPWRWTMVCLFQKQSPWVSQYWEPCWKWIL